MADPGAFRQGDALFEDGEGQTSLFGPRSLARAASEGEAASTRLAAASVPDSIIPIPTNIAPYTYVTASPPVHSGDVNHHGTLVVDVTNPYQNQRAIAVWQHNISDFSNDGEIFAFTDSSGLHPRGDASALYSELPNFTNSGLMAAQAVNGAAHTVHLDDGATMVNTATGRILAEGVRAIAVTITGGNLGAPGSVAVTNAGVIEARALPGGISAGLIVGHLSHMPFDIVNSGTIKAEFAIREDPYALSFQPQTGPDNLLNEAAGQIFGIVSYDRGDDSIENKGLIAGNVFMGEGADKVDTRTGTLNGVVDLGWGDDLFQGSAGEDFVAGDNGNDTLEGNGGADQLMGGGNDDLLIGGAGNDGLFGEYGNDHLVSEGGDWLSGGAGDDRIELGDYSFEFVSGDDGFDTLVLPDGARQLELSTVAAEGAIMGIEAIVLGGDKAVVIRPDAIDALTGGTQLSLEGEASDTIHLVGAWLSEGVVSIEGADYRLFSLDGRQVLVKGAATVSIAETSPIPAVGLDPISPGPLAPIPGQGQLDFTLTDFYLPNYELTGDVTINPEETWWNDTPLLPVLSGWYASFATLTNQGRIISYTETEVLARSVEATNLNRLVNEGEIFAVNLRHDPLIRPQDEDTAGFANAVVGGVSLTNNGLIEAQTLHGLAQAVASTAIVINNGEIRAYSEYGYAFGATDVSALTNTGIIYAEGRLGAVGILFLGGGSKPTTGHIEAVAGEGGKAVGVQFQVAYATSYTNLGVVVADIALELEQSAYSGYMPFSVLNGGTLDGQVRLGSAADTLENEGLITGDVDLSGGDDSYDGSAGIQSGTILGGAGADTIVGGAEADRIVGGAGADILEGGGGSDTFIYLAAGESTSAARDQIRRFESGTDRIDLTALQVSSIEWTPLTGGTPDTNLVTIGTDLGDLVLEVQGALTLSDFTLGIELSFGTPNDDVLEADGGTLEGLGGDDRLILTGRTGVADGGEGFDTIDYAGYDMAVTVSLPLDRGGVGSGHHLISIEGVIGSAFGDVIVGMNGQANVLSGGGGDDLILGMGGDDTLHGGDGDDRLEGGTGHDLLYGDDGDDRLVLTDRTGLADGGAGFDTIDYSAFASGVTVSLPIDRGGVGSGHQLFSIEAVVGTAFADLIIGMNGAANVLWGGGGADRLLGMGGDDTLHGGDGDDRLEGGTGHDLLYGGAGDDRLVLTDRTGVADGGDGFDTIDYSAHASGVTVSLPLDRGGVGSGHQLISIEGIVGSAFNDLLVGMNGQANVIEGGAGDDYILGFGGDDVLDGGSGADTLAGGTGSDTFVFTSWGGLDTIEDFSSADHDRIDLSGLGLSYEQLAFTTVTDGAMIGAVVGEGRLQIMLLGMTAPQLSESDFIF